MKDVKKSERRIDVCKLAITSMLIRASIKQCSRCSFNGRSARTRNPTTAAFRVHPNSPAACVACKTKRSIAGVLSIGGSTCCDTTGRNCPYLRGTASWRHPDAGCACRCSRGSAAAAPTARACTTRRGCGPRSSARSSIPVATNRATRSTTGRRYASMCFLSGDRRTCARRRVLVRCGCSSSTRDARHVPSGPAIDVQRCAPSRPAIDERWCVPSEPAIDVWWCPAACARPLWPHGARRCWSPAGASANDVRWPPFWSDAGLPAAGVPGRCNAAPRQSVGPGDLLDNG